MPMRTPDRPSLSAWDGDPIPLSTYARRLFQVTDEILRAAISDNAGVADCQHP